jgi:hypothetical protein
LIIVAKARSEEKSLTILNNTLCESESIIFIIEFHPSCLRMCQRAFCFGIRFCR